MIANNSPSHIPVMLKEVMEYLSPKDGEIYIDGTFGAGGYSREVLRRANCKLWAIDQDPGVIQYANELKKTAGDNFGFIQGKFGDMESLLPQHNIGKVNGIMLDIGVSSMQLDQGERGFSFMQNAKLDMRMSQNGKDAYQLVNQASESELADIIYYYGEEHGARRIAKKIVLERQSSPIETTFQLAAIVRSVVGYNKGKIDSATKTFQAIRIAINEELDQLKAALAAAEKLLVTGGRLVVVTFHSLEDSIVKKFFSDKSGKEKGVSRHIPIVNQPDTKNITFRLLTKNSVKPTNEEIKNNPRARSAKLRAALKLEKI